MQRTILNVGNGDLNVIAYENRGLSYGMSEDELTDADACLMHVTERLMPILGYTDGGKTVGIDGMTAQETSDVVGCVSQSVRMFLALCGRFDVTIDIGVVLMDDDLYECFQKRIAVGPISAILFDSIGLLAECGGTKILAERACRCWLCYMICWLRAMGVEDLKELLS